MKRLFVDSSVFFAAMHSARGHARDLFVLAGQEAVQLVVSDWVLTETRRNLAYLALDRADFFDYLVARLPLEIVTVTWRSVLVAGKRVVLKDAPVVAAARKARVDALVTYDRKHLLGRPEVAKYVRAPVVTPDEAIQLLQSK